MDELIYTLEEASSLSGVPLNTIKTKIRRGEVPSVQVPYGAKRFKLALTAKGLELLSQRPDGDYLKVLNQYLSEIKVGLITKKPVSPLYIETINRALGFYWKKAGKPKELRHINAEVLKDVLMSYQVDEANRRDYFATKDNIFKTITGFMRILIRDGYKTKVDLEAMKPLRPYKRFELKKKNYSEDIILAAIKKNEEWTKGRSDYDRKLMTTLIALYAYAGLRKVEPAQLYAENVHLDKRYMLVFGKGGVEDIVMIFPILLPYLEEWEKWRLKSSKFYVCSSDGKPLTADNINDRFKRFNRREGVQVSAHAMRRSFATIAATSKMPPSLIQKQLRHKHLTTTQGYIMVDDTHLMSYGLAQYGPEPKAPKEKKKREKSFRY